MKEVYNYQSLPFSALLSLLLGCAPPMITMNKIQHIEQGLSTEGFSAIVNRRTPRVLTVVDPEEGFEYQVQIYLMRTGTSIGSHSTEYMEWTTAEPIGEYYAFLFYNNSLVFWGFIHEFARSDEPYLRRLAPLILESLE